MPTRVAYGTIILGGLLCVGVLYVFLMRPLSDVDLHRAVERHDWALVERCVRQLGDGALRKPIVSDKRSNRHERCGATPLMMVAETGNIESVRYLLRRGVPVDDQVPIDFIGSAIPGETALHLATAAGESEVVQLLLDAGADPNVPNGQNRTPLWLAVRGHTWNPIENSEPQILRALLDAGADWRGVDTTDTTLLCWAAEAGNAPAVEVLLAAGADPNERCRPNRLTPLMFAGVGGNAAVVQLLIDAGADPNAVGRLGVTAIETATDGECPTTSRAAAEALVRAGANVCVRTSYGNSLIEWVEDRCWRRPDLRELVRTEWAKACK